MLYACQSQGPPSPQLSMQQHSSGLQQDTQPKSPSMLATTAHVTQASSRAEQYCSVPPPSNCRGSGVGSRTSLRYSIQSHSKTPVPSDPTSLVSARECTMHGSGVTGQETHAWRKKNIAHQGCRALCVQQQQSWYASQPRCAATARRLHAVACCTGVHMQVQLSRVHS